MERSETEFTESSSSASLSRATLERPTAAAVPKSNYDVNLAHAAGNISTAGEKGCGELS